MNSFIYYYAKHRYVVMESRSVFTEGTVRVGRGRWLPRHQEALRSFWLGGVVATILFPHGGGVYMNSFLH